MLEYKQRQSELIVPKLSDILSNLNMVLYICRVDNIIIEKCDGELDLNKIYEWMGNEC